MAGLDTSLLSALHGALFTYHPPPEEDLEPVQRRCIPAVVVVQRVHEVQDAGQQDQPQRGEAGPAPSADAQVGDAIIGLAL